MTAPEALFTDGAAYERLMGRWSRLVGEIFIEWLDVPPGLRWLDLMTLIRCPNNQHCNPNSKYGPGANMSASIQDCYVPPYEDSAIEKVAAK